MAAKKEVITAEINVLEIQTQKMEVFILGKSPMICARMSEKAKAELLAGGMRKSAVEKASSLKHDPLREYRDAPYRMLAPDAPTELAVLPTAFKKALATAALDVPGAKKTQIGRLVSVSWDRVPLYGVPMLFMSVVRSSDMKRTPDVRTRAIVPEWATTITIEFVKPNLREKTVMNLLAAAGVLCGVGDWRQEKGSGSFGAFELVSPDNEDYKRIVRTQGREAQLRALEEPESYDDETRDLRTWYDAEVKRRGFKVA